MKKAQGGPIAFIFMVFVFVLIWFMWIGGWLVDVGQTAIQEQQLTGIEAFFYANLNLCVLIGLILGILGFMYFVGRE